MQKLITYTLLTIFLALLLAPLYVMVVGSFTELQGFLAQPPALLLRNPSLLNYRIVLVGQPVAKWCINTATVMASTLTLSIISIVLAGYCVSRYPGRWVNAIYAAFLLTVMIPKNVLIIPLIVIFRNLGLSGTRAAAVLPSVFYAVGIYIYKTYLDKIPTTYDDCARMDGANEAQIITRVIVPMSRPAIAAVSTFIIMASMQDFLWQFLVLQRPSRRTLIVGLLHVVYQMGFGEMRVNPIGTKMAAGVIVFVPLLIAYAVLHRYFLTGITAGGIKG
jgi:multiple sugar transport system permease protein